VPRTKTLRKEIEKDANSRKGTIKGQGSQPAETENQKELKKEQVATGGKINLLWRRKKKTE